MTSPSHTLYRFFDATGVLLYVGRTVAPSKRWATHERKAPWYSEVATVTRTVHPDAASLANAERRAITTENPLHNIQHNISRQLKRETRTVPSGYAETAITRWISLDPSATVVEPITDCLGDETACECGECHDRRLCEFEDQRSKYDWHPDLDAEINAVEARYYDGHDLTDWYYDLYDIQMFARMRLVGESKARPIPAYADLVDGIARVECPFCFVVHQHVTPAGMPLDRAIESGCELIPGRYVMIADDWERFQDLQFQWGQLSAKRAVA